MDRYDAIGTDKNGEPFIGTIEAGSLPEAQAIAASGEVGHPSRWPVTIHTLRYQHGPVAGDFAHVARGPH